MQIVCQFHNSLTYWLMISLPVYIKYWLYKNMDTLNIVKLSKGMYAAVLFEPWEQVFWLYIMQINDFVLVKLDYVIKNIRSNKTRKTT